MAANESRSQNRDLSEGMTDGKYKKIATRERGGEVEHATALNRKHLGGGASGALADYYGMVEAPVKVRPDGKLA